MPVREQHTSFLLPTHQRFLEALVLAGCVALVPACSRQQSASGDTPQVAAAKGAVAHRLDAIDPPEFREVVEFHDGIVCGEFSSKKKFSGEDVGFRKFIYNAPEPGALVLDGGNLSAQEVGFWCSEQPDKRVKMLAASLAELAQACKAAGGKSTDVSCHLAETQKHTLEELQARSGASAPRVRQASAAAPAPAAPAAPALPAAPLAPPSAAVAAATPSPAPAPARSSSSDPEAAILQEVEVTLRNWRERWQAGDVDGYLRMYDPSFSGDAGSHAKWEQQRRRKMQDARPSIRIEKLQAGRITPQEVELHFVQTYSAKQHRDRGNKTLVFRRAPQGWLIADERWSPAR